MQYRQIDAVCTGVHRCNVYESVTYPDMKAVLKYYGIVKHLKGDGMVAIYYCVSVSRVIINGGG